MAPPPVFTLVAMLVGGGVSCAAHVQPRLKKHHEALHVHDSLALAGEDSQESRAVSLQLLQADVRLHGQDGPQEAPSYAMHQNLNTMGSLKYRSDFYWAPEPGAGLTEQRETGCELLAKDNGYSSEVPTAFALGECPRILAGPSQRLRLGLDPQHDGTNSPGYNPSLVPLPASLQQRFTSGKWLVALRAGDEHYAFSTCGHPEIVMTTEVARARPTLKMMLGTIHRSPGWLKWAVEVQDKVFQKNPRTYMAVLDENFRVLAKTPLTMRNGDGPWDDAAIQDMRMMQLGNGDILVGFQPYYLTMAEPAVNAALDWRLQECLALLHFNTTGPDDTLEAWVDRKETRVVQDCPGADRRAPGPKKNLGFFESDGKTYALDWAYPTRVGEVHLAALDASRHNSSEHYSHLCFGYEEAEEAPQGPRSPWDGLSTLDDDGTTKAVQMHNGSPLIWIEELGEWLGIGHTRRRLKQQASGKKPLLYTHQFFTVVGGPSQGRPFAMSRVSGEFCFSSQQHPGSCETVQMATSLLRIGNEVQVGYGVRDCESFITYLSLNEVVALLKKLE